MSTGTRIRMPHRVIAATLTTVALVAGCSSYSSPTNNGGTPSGIAVVTGNAQVGTVGTGLTLPLVVKVSDPYGAGMSGVVVNFVATGGATLRSATANTDATGLATDSVTTLSTAGTGTITATASGITGSAVFTFTAH